MEKKYQVFISSTYTDLIEERQKVVEAILSAGHIPAGMELFSAGNETQKELIEEWIKASDIYVLLLGARYGSIDVETGKSYTQWEYEKAFELEKPCFSLVLTEKYIEKRIEEKELSPLEIEIKDPKFIEFKKTVMDKIVSEIRSLDQIEGEIHKSLNRIVKKEKNLEGWIKGDNLNKIEKLEKENKELREKLLNRQDEVINMKNELKEIKDEYVGDYNFSFLYNILSNKKIESQESVDDLIADLKEEMEVHDRKSYVTKSQRESYLAEFEELKNLTCLQWIEKNKQDILTGDMLIYPDRYLDYIKNEFLPILDQYGLICFDESKHQGINLLKFTENGKKFLSLLDMKNAPS